MSVARMLKVTVLGHGSVVDDVVDALQGVGILQVVEHEQDIPDSAVPASDERFRSAEELAADASSVCDFLGRYRTVDVPFSAFVSEKFHIDQDEFEAIAPDERFIEVYRECTAIADALASGERETARLKALASDLEPWTDLHLQLQSIKGTEHVAMFAGTVPSSQAERIRQTLRDAVAEVSVEQLGSVGTRQAWVVMAHHDHLAQARSALALTPFAEASFPGLSDYPAEERARALGRIEELEQERAELIARATALASEYYEQAVYVREALAARLDALRVRADFGHTERAFAITGWVQVAKRDGLLAALEPWGDALDTTLEEPTADDNPPVELVNPWFFRPFEVLTDLYGRPAYDEIDPTPLLAPFFLLFFSICIGDVGYGAMLLAGAYLIKTRLDVAPGVRKFMDLLMFGGVGAMVLGVLFGSYFALDALYIPKPLLALKVIDPMAELTTFLILTVVLGVIQVFFGVIVAAIDAWRRGDARSAIFEQLSTIFLFAMIGVAVVVPGASRAALVVGLLGTMLMQGRALEAALGEPTCAAWDRGLGWAWLAAVLGWMASLSLGGPAWVTWAFLGFSVIGAIASKTVRSSVIALLGGAYSVYGMSAFIGDILSYTRLAALGLSGALVGMVFNLLAGLVLSPAVGMVKGGGLGILWGVIVFLLGAAVFVVGHVFNVVINLLGAFVHPARLQFVEFFSKFYEGGGKAFAPFGFASKSLVLHAGGAGAEGGTES